MKAMNVKPTEKKKNEITVPKEKKISLPPIQSEREISLYSLKKMNYAKF